MTTTDSFHISVKSPGLLSGHSTSTLCVRKEKDEARITCDRKEYLLAYLDGELALVRVK